MNYELKNESPYLLQQNHQKLNYKKNLALFIIYNIISIICVIYVMKCPLNAGPIGSLYVWLYRIMKMSKCVDLTLFISINVYLNFFTEVNHKYYNSKLCGRLPKDTYRTICAL